MHMNSESGTGITFGSNCLSHIHINARSAATDLKGNAMAVTVSVFRLHAGIMEDISRAAAIRTL